MKCDVVLVDRLLTFAVNDERTVAHDTMAFRDRGQNLTIDEEKCLAMIRPNTLATCDCPGSTRASSI